jgi:hypothetical protein
MTTIGLPAGFESLEPFAARWGGLETTAERYRMRQDTPFAELEAFHAAMAPRLEEVFRHLDAFSPDDLPQPQERLFRTALGLIEAGEAVEYFGQSRMNGAPYPHEVAIEATLLGGASAK